MARALALGLALLLLLVAGPLAAQDDEGGAGEDIDDGQKLDRTDQMYHDVHTKLAAKALKVKNLQKARDELNLVLERSPRHAVTHFRMAIVCAKMKDFKEAWRHLELGRAVMEKHKEVARFKAFEEKLAAAFPKPADLSLEAPKEALPEPRFQGEAALVFLVQVAENKDIVSRIERLEGTPLENGAFTLTLVGSGPLDAGPVETALGTVPGARCERGPPASDSKRVTFKVTLTGALPAENPALQAVSLGDYFERRDQSARDADVSLRNQRESEPDPATGLAKGTYEFMGRDLRAVLTMLGDLGDCLADYAVLRAGPSEFNQQKVWKGEITVRVKQGS